MFVFLLEANRVLIEINQVNRIHQNDLDIVLRSFVRLFGEKIFFNCLYFTNLYRDWHSCLVNFFIDIYRKQMIQMLIWGFVYLMTFKEKKFAFIDSLRQFRLKLLLTMLAYESSDICQEYLQSLGIVCHRWIDVN